MYKKLTLCVTFILCGCAYEWHHPYKNKSMFYADSEHCEVKALQMYPQIMTSKEIRPAFQTPPVTTCQAGPNGQSICTTTPGSFSPPQYRTIDVNKYNREAAVSNCLQALGWRLEKKQ